MIEHLKGRERALASLGWTGREAEWIALGCLHSGVFTRAQFCRYFDAARKRAYRFVKALIDRKEAVERVSTSSAPQVRPSPGGSISNLTIFPWIILIGERRRPDRYEQRGQRACTT